MLADRRTRANPEAMRRAAKVLGLDVPKARGPKVDSDLLSALRIEINKRLSSISEDDHIKCTCCGEIATEDTSFCPYCGDEGSPTEEDAIAADKAASAKAAVVEDDEELQDEDAEDEELTVDDSVGISGRESVVVKNVDAAMAGLEKDLDSALAKIVDLKKSAVGLSYDIGMVCREIRDRQLFKARGYASFKAFAEKELPFTRESALQLIAIVEKYGRDEYEQIGYSKLRVISAVTDTAVKAELIEAAKTGATTKELSERATAAGATPSSKKAAAAAAPAPAPAPDKGERITLLGKVGGKKQVVRLHNSETGEVIPCAGAFTKKSFVPSAYGELEISAGVFIRIGLRVSADMELEGFTVRIVRAADES